MGDFGRADAAERARAVLDDNRLVERLLQMLAQQPRHLVRAGAAGEGHNDPDRPPGIIVIRRESVRCGKGNKKQAGENSRSQPHWHPPGSLF